MTSLSDLIDEFDQTRETIVNMVDEFRQKVYTVLDTYNLPSVECKIPQPEETLVTFELHDSIVVTEWLYTDCYDAIGDRNTIWSIPLEWFDMSGSDIEETLIGIEKVETEKYLNQRIDQLKMDAEDIGFELVKKTQ